MKLVRNIFVVAAALAIAVSFYGISSANEKGCGWGEGMEKCEANIKVLKDSASALEQSNPDLAKGLNDMAAWKEKMVQEWKEKKAKYDAKKKLLNDSAVALEKTNPELAKGLKEMAEMKYKHNMRKHEMAEGKSEKEMPQETMKPAEAQGETKI